MNVLVSSFVRDTTSRFTNHGQHGSLSNLRPDVQRRLALQDPGQDDIPIRASFDVSEKEMCFMCGGELEVISSRIHIPCI